MSDTLFLCFHDDVTVQRPCTSASVLKGYHEYIQPTSTPYRCQCHDASDLFGLGLSVLLEFWREVVSI